MKPDIKAVDPRDDAAGAGEEAPPPLTAVHSFAEKIGSRNLMIAIVTMPFLFIGALALIIAAVGLPQEDASAEGSLDEILAAGPVTRAPDAAAPPGAAQAPSAETAAARRSAQPVPPVAAASPSAADPSFTAAAAIPSGGLALDGDRLAVRIERPDGPVVVVYDLSKGAVTHEVPLAPLGAAR